jgi:pilus assembly protein CpaE
MSEIHQVPDASDGRSVSVALIGPDQQRREAVACALSGCQGVSVREFPCFPAYLDDLPQMLEQHYDAVIVDLDSDPEYALDVVESICAINSTCVMVYSAQADLKMAIRFMRAGAREFLTLPIASAEITRALTRVSIRHQATRQARRSAGKLFAFLGSKGGCGVTTIASNFAVSLAQESEQTTVLIDFGQPLGDVAINLGMNTEYSTANALHETTRLDGNFLSSLLAKHSSGLSVLAAPGEFSEPPALEAIDRLLAVARQRFDHIVVDAGSRVDLMSTALFGDSTTIYLISQVGVSELRNANRMITRFFAKRGQSLQVVLNRYTAHSLLFDEEHIVKALTRPVDWKVPDDYAAARRTHSTASPLALDDSPISHVIRQIARTACGLPAQPEKKKGFRLFG